MNRAHVILSRLPPSINGQKAAVGGRLIKTKDYRDWQTEMEIEVWPQRGIGYLPALWSSLILFPCNASKMDVDNAPKAIHDLLVSAGLTPDDRYLVDSHIKWAACDNVQITIEIEDPEPWLKIKNMGKATARKLWSPQTS